MKFWAKWDLSIDENSMARLEKLSFDAYHEPNVLIRAIERYCEQTRHYSERALVNKIYRNRDNLAYCKLHGIRLSEPSLEWPKKDAVANKKWNILTMLTAWRLEGHLALPRGAMDLAGL